jgi:hypothetical protein
MPPGRKSNKPTKDWCKILGLTVDELKELAQKARNTWEYIGQDCIDCNEGKALSRDSVVEGIMDCDYFYIANSKVSLGLKVVWDDLNKTADVEAYLKEEVFTYKWYE